jgi:hypothetical protein
MLVTFNQKGFCDLREFDIHGLVHYDMIYENEQQDATV